MFKWGFIFVAIAAAMGALGFGALSGVLANVFGGLFFIFIAIALFLFFAAAMNVNRPVHR